MTGTHLLAQQVFASCDRVKPIAQSQVLDVSVVQQNCSHPPLSCKHTPVQYTWRQHIQCIDILRQFTASINRIQKQATNLGQWLRQIVTDFGNSLAAVMSIKFFYDVQKSTCALTRRAADTNLPIENQKTSNKHLQFTFGRYHMYYKSYQHGSSSCKGTSGFCTSCGQPQ